MLFGAGSGTRTYAVSCRRVQRADRLREVQRGAAGPGGDPAERGGERPERRRERAELAVERHGPPRPARVAVPGDCAVALPPLQGHEELGARDRLALRGEEEKQAVRL